MGFRFSLCISIIIVKMDTRGVDTFVTERKKCIKHA